MEQLLASSRLVTLTGTGGVGKTRLALALTHSLRENFPHGVGFVDLTDVSDAARLFEQIGMGLELQKEKSLSWQNFLLTFLEDKSLLLVWDNCEHLLKECRELTSQLLKNCPSLRLLLTSREPLRTYGEARYLVPSLSLPTSDEDTAPEALSQYSAIQLFLARAKAVKAGFCLTTQNSPAISKICRDLDGLPLAIEIAASLVDICKVEKLTAKLFTRFDLLAEGPHTETARHRSLWAAFDVSYDLLSPTEQSLFRRLGVFVGSFSAEAVAAVSADAGCPPLETPSLLSQLVRKSLVVAEEQDDELRYRLLLTLRQYALNRLQEQGEEEAARRRHRDYYLQFAEEAAPQLRGPEQKRWLNRLEMEHDNFRAALAWRVDENALSLACALQRFWWVRGYLEEGRRWLERKVETDNAVPGKVQARVLISTARLAQAQGALAEAKKLSEESLALWLAQGDQQGIADALFSLGTLAEHLGDYKEATRLHQESLRLYHELEDKHGVASALYGGATIQQNLDNYAAAIGMHQESLRLRRELGDILGISHSVSHLGTVACMQGRFEEAKPLYEESLALKRLLGDKRGVAKLLSCLGSLATDRGDYEEARHIHNQCLALFQDAGDKYGVAEALNGLASLAYSEGDFERAKELMERCLALLRLLGVRSGIAILLSNLGSIARQQRRFAESKKLLTEGLVQHQQLEEKSCVANSLGQIAFLAAAEGEYHRAARLWGTEEALLKEIGCRRPPNEDAPRERSVQEVRKALGAEAFEAAWAEGRAMTWEQAVAFALGEDAP